MLDSDRQEFSMAISALAVVFNRQADQALLEAYWLFLEDVPWPDAQQAVLRAGRTLKFMPTPSELRELAGVATAKQRAVLAWVVICEAAGRIGSYRSVGFEDPLINAAIRALGGWPRLLGLGGEEFDKWARLEFLKAYELLDGSASPEECRPLAGLGTIEEEPIRVECEYVRSDQRLLSLSQQSELAYVQAGCPRTGPVSRLQREPLLLRDVWQDEASGGYPGASPELREGRTGEVE